jgi:hypothetical protein
MHPELIPAKTIAMKNGNTLAFQTMNTLRKKQEFFCMEYTIFEGAAYPWSGITVLLDLSGETIITGCGVESINSHKFAGTFWHSNNENKNITGLTSDTLLCSPNCIAVGYIFIVPVQVHN